jgi:hypothetical protein
MHHKGVMNKSVVEWGYKQGRGAAARSGAHQITGYMHAPFMQKMAILSYLTNTSSLLMRNLLRLIAFSVCYLVIHFFIHVIVFSPLPAHAKFFKPHRFIGSLKC